MAFSLKDLKGSMVALITPFRGGAVDEPAFTKFVEWQIEQGTHALVPCGTTGESPTLSDDEHARLVEICVKTAKGRVPVIAGAGSNSTTHAVNLARHAKEAGADAVLVVSPYYNKPTQEGLYLHFKTVAQAADLPLLLYNVPARTIVDISVETMARLARIPNIAGVKDATANLARASQQRHAIGKDFLLISGDDASALGFMAHGGVGCISVTANIAPKLCAQFQTACLKGDYASALAIQDKLMPLHDALFAETSPAPAKYAAHMLGHCEPYCRLPLAPVTDATKAKLRAAMQHAGIAVS